MVRLTRALLILNVFRGSVMGESISKQGQEVSFEKLWISSCVFFAHVWIQIALRTGIKDLRACGTRNLLLVK